MAEEVQDANLNVDANVSDSSTEEGNSAVDASDDGSSTPSAETLKTEEQPPFHEHPRWKEVVEENKKLKEKQATYDKLDYLLESNPELNEYYAEGIEKLKNGELTKKEEAQLKDDIQNATPQVDPSVAGITYHMYNQEFTGLAKGDGYDTPEDIQALGAATTAILKQMNPNAFNVFTPGIVQKAYQEAKQIFEGFASRRTKNYIKDKADESNPPMSTGAPVTTESTISSREDAVKHVSQGLKDFFK